MSDQPNFDRIFDRFRTMVRNHVGKDSCIVQDWAVRYLEQHGDRKSCSSCGKVIWWMRHADTQKAAPYNQDGTSHFATCVHADQHRK